MSAPLPFPGPQTANAIADRLERIASDLGAPIWASDRLGTELKRLIDAHGLDDVLHTLSCVAGDTALEHDGEAARDWTFAAAVISAAQYGCDLAYGERGADGTPAFTMRTRARDRFMDLAAALRS